MSSECYFCDKCSETFDRCACPSNPLAQHQETWKKLHRKIDEAERAAAVACEEYEAKIVQLKARVKELENPKCPECNGDGYIQGYDIREGCNMCDCDGTISAERMLAHQCEVAVIDANIDRRMPIEQENDHLKEQLNIANKRAEKLEAKVKGLEISIDNCHKGRDAVWAERDALKVEITKIKTSDDCATKTKAHRPEEDSAGQASSYNKVKRRDELRAKLRNLEVEMLMARDFGDIDEYNYLVRKYNKLLPEYNTFLDDSAHG